MAVDKLVDSAQLDADLTSVADAIREKGGTSESLAFPAGFVSAIGAISGGGVKVATGTFTLPYKTEAIIISCEDAPAYRYLAVFLSDMIHQKPGYKSFFFAIADFKIQRKWFGYTNNAGTSDVGNMYANGIGEPASKIESVSALGQFILANNTGATTGSTFGAFMPGNYTWVTWGDINE